MAASNITLADDTQLATWAGQLHSLLRRTCGPAGDSFQEADESEQELFLQACRDIAQRLEAALAERAVAAPA